MVTTIKLGKCCSNAELPQATFASKVELQSGSVEVTREIDGGLETLKAELPAIVTTDLRLNEPRYASLPTYESKKKPIDELDLATLGVSPENRVELVAVESPAERQEGVKVSRDDS